MKVKTKAKLLSPLLIIAMVVSLMAGALMVAPQAALATMPDGETTLGVTIVAPSEVTECDTFKVEATVTNTGADYDAEDVVATLDVYGDASLVDGEGPDKHLGDIAPGDSEYPSWTLHCDESGEVLIIVTADADNADPFSRLHEMTQLDAPETLFYVVLEELTGPFSTCQDFMVNATIYNDTEYEVTVDPADIVLTVDPSDTATIEAGPLPAPSNEFYEIAAGGDLPLTWILHCEDAGYSTLKVEVAGAYTITDEDVGTGDGEQTVWTLAHHPVVPGSDEIDLIGQVAPWDYDIEYATGKVTFTPAPEEGILIVADYDVEGDVDGDSTWILQQTPAALVATITPADGTTVSCCDYFDVTVTVTNTGQADAYDVAGTIDIIGNVDGAGTDIPFGPVDIAGSTAVPVYTASLHCDEVGDVIIEVTELSMGIAGELVGIGDAETTVFTLDRTPVVEDSETIYLDDVETDAYTIVDATITFDPAPGDGVIITADYRAEMGDLLPSVTVDQVPLTVVIVDWPKDEVDISDDFSINAVIYNNCDETDVTGVTATISWVGNASLTPDQELTKEIGTVLAGDEQPVGWTLHCDGYGDVTITVSTTGTYVVDDTPVEATVTSDPVIVHQPPEPLLPSPYLYVDIMSPEAGTYIGTGQEFMVTAVVYNYGEADATDVTATIEIDPELVAMGMPATAHLVPPPEPPEATIVIDTISAMGYEVVTWTLRCDWAELDMPTEIVVTATWTDANTGDTMTTEPATVSVYQYPAAYLVVDISAPEDGSTYTVCDEFEVTATVTNTGWADAWDVSLTLSVYPEGSVVLMEGGYTQDVGCLAGHGQNGSAEVTWYVHCKQSCSTTITVTVEGKDEFGYQVVTDVTWYDEYIYGYYDGWVEGWYEYDGESYGYWDGYISGEWCGDLYGYFTGYVDDMWWDDYYEGYMCDDVDGYFTGYHDGDFYGYVDGYFTGWSDGYFYGSYTETTVTANPWAHIDEQFIENDSITVKQYDGAYLEITDIAYHEQVETCQDFLVAVVVMNTGDAEAKDVIPTIYYDETVMELVWGPDPATADIAAGDTAAFVFMLHGDVAALTVFGVEVVGTDTNTAISGGILELVDPAPAPVPAPANLEVDISYPDQIIVGQDYAVTAVVSNTGDATATDVDVTLTIAGHATLLIGEYLTQTIDTIAAGSSATVEWVLHADDEGGVNVAVSATGTDTNTASDSGAVQQAAAPVPAPVAATGFAAFGWLLAPILVGLGFVGLMLFLGLRRPSA